MTSRGVVEFSLDRVEAKMCACALCILMLMRHFQFYFPFESIINEMGHLQSIWGIFLIPVTASFGLFAHMRRGKLATDGWAMGRLLLLGLIPVALAIWDGDFTQVFSYTYTDHAARPRLLILLPIAVSLLVRLLLFKENPLGSILIFLGTLFIYEITSSFVAHYVVIFLGVGLFFQYWERLLIPSMWVALFLYFGLAVFVLLAKLDRVSVWYELVWTASFVSVAVCFAKTIVLRGFTVMFPPILYFYLCQAVIFNVAALFLSPESFPSSAIILLLVFVFTFCAAATLEYLEEKTKKYCFNRFSGSSHP